MVQSGANTWFCLVADHVFGRTIEAEGSRLVKESGGRVLGAAYHPQATTDFAAYLLQAQGSHAMADKSWWG